nr:MAG TPA: hypothetical protein [Bacteriophage sp.]
MGAKKYPLKCWKTLKPTKSRGRFPVPIWSESRNNVVGWPTLK